MGYEKLIKDKRGLELKNAFFAILVFSIVIIAVGVIVGEWGTKYNSGVTSDLEEYNTLPEVYSDIQTQKGKITPDDPEPQRQDAESSTFLGSYGIMTTVFKSFDLVLNEGGMLDSISDRFDIPDYVVQFLVAAMTVAIIFTLVAIVFRRNKA